MREHGAAGVPGQEDADDGDADDGAAGRASMVFLGLSFMPKKSCTRSWDTLEAAASSWESAVDMVAARMPDRIRPATMREQDTRAG